jgi:hypothetical protein
MPRGVKGSGPHSKKPPPAVILEAVRRAPEPATVQPRVVYDRRDKPLGSVDVDSLSGDALRAYARRAGVSPRDVENLTEDRLRQNTKLTIANHFDLLTED